ncbi:MAG: hypothetical protein ACXQS8_02140 [Candidatus Helarchaeales archaeon]
MKHDSIMKNPIQVISNTADQIFMTVENRVKKEGLFSNPDNEAAWLGELEEKKRIFNEKISVLNKCRKKNTSEGRHLIQALMTRMLDMQNQARHSNDIVPILHELDVFQDELEITRKEINNVAYNHVILTLVGFFVSILPYFNLLSFGIGAYLMFARDFRAKIMGIAVISYTLFNLIFAQLILVLVSLLLF